MSSSRHGLMATIIPNPAWTVGVLVGLVAIVALYLYLLPRPLPGIPYDKKDVRTPLGSLPSIIAHTAETGHLIPWFTDQIEKHNSPIVQIWVPPLFKTDIIISDPAIAEDVFIRRTKEFDRSQVMIDVFKGGAPNHHIAMKTSDPRFKGNKELVRDLMSPAFLHGTSAAEIHLKTSHLIKLWQHKTKLANGRPFDAEQDVKDAALDMIFAAAFAFHDGLSSVRHQLDYLTSMALFSPETANNGAAVFPIPAPIPEAALFYDVIHAAGAPAASPTPTLTFHYNYWTKPHIRRNIAAKNALIHREIRKSLDRLSARSDDGVSHSAVDNILRREKVVASKEGREPDYFSRRVQDELFGYVVAGFETTATSMRWNLKFLADHPDVQNKLRAALRENFAAAVAGRRWPSATEIMETDIPYLDAVIEECLRVGSTVRILHRDAQVDTEIMGHRIPKGTTVFFPIAGPGYKKPALKVDEALRPEKQRTGMWNDDDVHLLKPERWLVEKDGEMKFDPHAGPFMTFSLGPRGCFGRKLAYMELRMMMVMWIWSFQLKKLEGEMGSYDYTEGITAAVKDCHVCLEEVAY